MSDEELMSDLGKGYYKMSQQKIIALVACTVSICISVFGGILYFDKRATITQMDVDNQKIEIQYLKSQVTSLQGQINSLLKK